MPMKLCVGLSRKVGEPNYSSRGGSIHLEVEVDGSLLADPQQLHKRIRQCFALARSALEEELNGHGHTVTADMPAAASAPVRHNGPGDAAAVRNGGDNHTGAVRPATPAQ